MNPKFTAWTIALLSAIVLHAVVLNLPSLNTKQEIESRPSSIELVLLPPAPLTSPDKNTQDSADNTQNTNAPDTLNASALEEPQSVEEPQSMEEPQANDLLLDDTRPLEDNLALEEESIVLGEESIALKNALERPKQEEASIYADEAQIDIAGRPSLLDLSQVDLANASVEKSSVVFSKELREQIAASRKAQQAYLNSLPDEQESYVITQDADGTRYANIKGVCWRLPKEGSNEGWAIVFDGCGIKSKLFHIELNISPKILTNELLGPDSPFNEHFQSN